jgi:hypothetical protein
MLAHSKVHILNSREQHHANTSIFVWNRTFTATFLAATSAAAARTDGHHVIYFSMAP